MNTIHVDASKSYNVHIGANLLKDIGKYVLTVKRKCTCVIISDSNVWSHYGQLVKNSLTQYGYTSVEFVFPAGEASKCPDTYLQILNFLIEKQITRSDLIVALGGGVTGDLSGFVAATYLRGIDYIQVPTSLLAMVDSSVGGKTAIDMPAGKNLVGAFYQPIMVLCDTDTLNTLPANIFRDGCAEVIKYGILYSPKLFEHLETHILNFDREFVISECVNLKRDVVAKDEFDTAERQKLNLGHTFGHCIEAESAFSISHGQAVAIGICIISKASYNLAIGCMDLLERIRSVIISFGLPHSTSYTAESLIKHALSDKKRSGGKVNLIIPEEIGSCIVRSTPVEDLKQVLESGL